MQPVWAAEPDVADLIYVLVQARRAQSDDARRPLALRLGVSVSTVTDWEVGRDTPTVLHLIQWARDFGLRLAICDDYGDRSLPELVALEGESWESCEVRRIGATLHDLRRVRELTQSAVASALGISALTVLRWEQARQVPRLRLLVRWARSLGGVVQLRSIKPPWRLEEHVEPVYD